MDTKTLQQKYPIGTWVRFYHDGCAVISPVIGYDAGLYSAPQNVRTELCPIRADSIIDCRLPDSELP